MWPKVQVEIAAAAPAERRLSAFCTIMAAPSLHPNPHKHTTLSPPSPCLPQSKALAVRKWLAVNADGELRHLELAKLRVTHYLGVQLRDLRWAVAAAEDPTLAPCCMLPSPGLASLRLLFCWMCSSSACMLSQCGDGLLVFVGL